MMFSMQIPFLLATDLRTRAWGTPGRSLRVICSHTMRDLGIAELGRGRSVYRDHPCGSAVHRRR